jgi:hypothetical protein
MARGTLRAPPLANRGEDARGKTALTHPEPLCGHLWCSRFRVREPMVKRYIISPPGGRVLGACLPDVPLSAAPFLHKGH